MILIKSDCLYGDHFLLTFLLLQIFFPDIGFNTGRRSKV